MAKIDLVRLTKTFDGGVTAVHDLDLTIEDGEFLSLLGPSGCGKTTTLRCVAGLERPTSGEILFDDVPAVSARRGVFVPPEKRHMGMVFQSYALWPHMTSRANIAYPLRRAKVARSEITARVDEMLAVVGLDDHGDRLPGKLSGGQQQRVALARALINHPRVVLFDEPFSNLDTLLRGQMRREVRRLHERLGTTSIYVTHDRIEAMALSDRIAVLKDGIVQQVGTPREIYTAPANRFVADFIGFDNLVKATVARGNGGQPVVRLGADGPQLRCATSVDHSSGSVVEIAVRSTSFRILPRSSAAENGFTATVQSVTYLGEDVEFQATAGETSLIARVSDVDVRHANAGSVPAGGDTIHLRVDPEELVEIGR